MRVGRGALLDSGKHESPRPTYSVDRSTVAVMVEPTAARVSHERLALACWIIRVCHAFDAMMSPRPYRPALSSEAALAELEDRAGTSFDSAVARVLSALVRARVEGTRAA